MPLYECTLPSETFTPNAGDTSKTVSAYSIDTFFDLSLLLMNKRIFYFEQGLLVYKMQERHAVSNFSTKLDLPYIPKYVAYLLIADF